jgi:hypothetical protein
LRGVQKADGDVDGGPSREVGYPMVIVSDSHPRAFCRDT